jgi:hypothetical protein
MRREKSFAPAFTSFAFTLLIAHALGLFLPVHAVAQPAREPVIYLNQA